MKKEKIKENKNPTPLALTYRPEHTLHTQKKILKILSKRKKKEEPKRKEEEGEGKEEGAKLNHLHQTQVYQVHYCHSKVGVSKPRT